MQNRTSDASSDDSGRNPDSRDRGFLLVTVIWGVGLLSVFVMLYVLNIRTHTKIAANLIARAQLEAQADAGVFLAVKDLIETARLLPEKWRFSHNSRTEKCKPDPHTVLEISIQDEEGKLDLNAAGAPLLRTVIAGLGVPALRASHYADAIIDFRDTDSLRRPNGAENNDYKAAGKTAGPKNFPFQSVNELHQVLGLPLDLIEKLKPLATVHSKRAGVDLNTAPASLRKILERAKKAAPLYAIASNRKTFSIRAAARRVDQSMFVREAIVKLNPATAGQYQFLVWRRGGVSSVINDPQGSTPEC